MESLYIGKIVEFFPGSGGVGVNLPKNMTSAPAIIMKTPEQDSQVVDLAVISSDGNGSIQLISAMMCLSGMQIRKPCLRMRMLHTGM